MRRRYAAPPDEAGVAAIVALLDRYEIGERQTSACAAPTEWLEALGLEPSIRQTFDELVIHTPHVTTTMRLPWSFSTFDYPQLCDLLWQECDADFETAKVEGRTGAIVPAGTADDGEPIAIATDRGVVEAPLVVDCLGWRRVLDDGYQPPDAPLSRGLEVHPGGVNDELEIWIDRDIVPAGYGWNDRSGALTRRALLIPVRAGGDQRMARSIVAARETSSASNASRFRRGRGEIGRGLIS